jgi:hypothetical protein
VAQGSPDVEPAGPGPSEEPLTAGGSPANWLGPFGSPSGRLTWNVDLPSLEPGAPVLLGTPCSFALLTL